MVIVYTLVAASCASALPFNAKRSPKKNDNRAFTFEDDFSRTYFVIGIGMYIEGGTWPVVDEICPILLIRFGKHPHILTPKSGECIDFTEGDKFIGYYPFLNPIGIGFVYGIWIDVER